MKKTLIGILAHVDSGKTTLSEGMLYLSGVLRKIGRVDHKDAFLDTHEIERERGITIFSKQAQLSCGDTEITLLDTPGHIDFSAEAERTLSVLDYAILVINGTDGVQSHTETLWQLLKRYGIPTFLFINKMDICEYSHEVLIRNIQASFGDGCIDFGLGCEDESFCESAALCDEELMEIFLSCGKTDKERLKTLIAERKIFPCYFGSALKLDGVRALLDGIDEFTVSKYDKNGEFGAQVFKISEDEQGKRLTHAKITSGSIRVRDSITVKAADGSEQAEKINEIRIYSGAKFKTVSVAEAGDVCVFTGPSKTYSGEGLGAADDAVRPVIEPVMTYVLKLPQGTEVFSAYRKLKQLEDEDPQLNITYSERFREISVQLMGSVQTEVLKRIIADRFGIDAEFESGRIIYKETIAAAVEGVGHYEPLRHYAEVHLKLEPLERGKGLIFAAECSEDELDRNWQRLILTHLQEKTHIGVLTGMPITDMKITLIAGRAHKKHTEGGDFRHATYRAVRHGLRCAESVLLEPWYSFSAEIPTENIGRFMNDIQQMGGSFSAPITDGDVSKLSGKVPASEMVEYQAELIGYTKGRGRMNCTVSGYEPCHNADEVIAAIGYDCDADTENTADSVFCSHGAGYTVKWCDVREHMHIDTGFGKPQTDSENRGEVRRVSRATVDDKELMKIFERTYGAIKQRVPQKDRIIRSGQAESSNWTKNKAKKQKTGKEYLLVDGYNIIFAWETLKAMAEESLDMARTRLINILCNYGGFKRCEIIAVFDAYKVKGNHGEAEKIDNISVVYTKEAETADTYIEKATKELSRENRVRVATSDNMEQLIILGNGAYRISADAFLDEVLSVEKEIREFLTE